jgi:3-keto-disaccharide hydrolase
MKGNLTMAALVVVSGIWPVSPTSAPDSVEALSNRSPKPGVKDGPKIRLFDSTTLDGWIQVPPNTWTVKDSAMASTGAGRGFIYTKDDYSHYRLTFSVRQVSGNHQPCFLIFGTRPPDGEKGLDALGAVQFQVPNGGSWDYRPGKNNNGGDLFTRPVPKTKFEYGQWSRVEILVNAETGTARMAVAQPVGTKAIENLDFHDSTAGKAGPIAWQMHNADIFDEYKDVVIEMNPAVDDLLTTN